MASDELRVRWSGGEHTFTPGTILIGRDLGAQIQPTNTNVSRRHLEVVHGPRGWVARDLGSAQGTWRDGARVEQVPVTGSVRLVLGRVGVGEEIELSASSPGTQVGGIAPQATEIVGQRPEATTGPSGPSGPVSAGTVVVGAAADRPGGRLREEAVAGATVVTGDSISVECGGRSATFLPGREVVIGRDDTCDVVSSNPTVSRRHARLVHDGSTWHLEDLSSSGGTFVDGSRVTRLPLAGSVAVWLGDEETGERVVLVAKGTRPKRKQRRSPVALVGVALLVAAVVAAVVLFLGRGPSDDELARGSVRIDAGGWSGSGTIIDAELGLILTNADVAEPRAPGSAVDQFLMEDELEENPERLEIQVATGKDKDAEPRYVANVVAVDGYLDLAVLRIVETVGGRIIEPGDLSDLTEIAIGNSDDLETGDEIRVFGYPRAAQSRTVTLTEGVVSGPVKDERLGSNRAMLNIDAEIRGGNSGGTAVNGKGELVGIPTLIREDTVSSMRPVTWAIPLIEEAKENNEYRSPHVKALADEEVGELKIVSAGPSTGIEMTCDGADGEQQRGVLGFAFEFDGFESGEHQDMMIRVTAGGSIVGLWAATGEYPTNWPSSGCARVTVPLDTDSIPSEDTPLRVRVGIGPEYRELETFTLTREGG